MNQLSLRNNQLKFKTWGKLPIVLEEYREYTSNDERRTERSQPRNRLDLDMSGTRDTKILEHELIKLKRVSRGELIRT